MKHKKTQVLPVTDRCHTGDRVVELAASRYCRNSVQWLSHYRWVKSAQ